MPTREELEASAPIARRLSSELCVDGCAGYHGVIQDLKLLDLVMAPRRRADFYREALVTTPNTRDLLISGCADYEMLEVVVDAFAAAGKPLPAVTALDMCRTPVELCKWWCAQRSMTIETLALDACALDAEERWDVIVTESLYSLLTPEERVRVTAAWTRALRPGGALVTVCRLEPGGGPEPPTEERADAFEAGVRAAAEAATRLPPGLDADALADAARRHVWSVHVWPIASESELRTLLDDAGLEVERFDVWQSGESMTSSEAPPGMRRAATYARVVARRP